MDRRNQCVDIDTESKWRKISKRRPRNGLRSIRPNTVSSTHVFGCLKGIRHAFCTICMLFKKKVGIV